MALGFTISYCNQNQSEDEGAGRDDDEAEIVHEDGTAVDVILGIRIIFVEDGGRCPNDCQVRSEDVSE